MSVAQVDSVRFAAVTTSATNTTLIAAVAGKSIVVLNACFTISGTAPAATFRSGASTLITGAFTGPTAVGSALMCPLNGSRLSPLFSTAKGESLDVVLPAATLFAGFITYTLEDAQ